MSVTRRGILEAVRRYARGVVRGGTAVRVAVIAAALACLVGQTMGLAAPTPALAAGEQASYHNVPTGDVGPFDATIFGCYQRTDDDSAAGVAYCMDGEKHGPSPDATYTNEGGTDTVLSYLAAHGYPNETTICGTCSAQERPGP